MPNEDQRMALLGILAGELLAEATRCARDENPLFLLSVHIHNWHPFFAFSSFQGHWIFVQGQRCSFEIGKDGGPTLFTESFDCGALG